MDAELERLVDSLLYEGYALYPYTPQAQKNATPTPFGIVYPPAYAARWSSTFDHTRLQCVAEPAAGATLTATARFLRPSGERHTAEAEQVQIDAVALSERRTVEFPGGRLTLRSQPREGGAWQVSCCLHNTAEVDPGPERSVALRHALISVQLVVEVSAGRFRSPLDTPDCENVNTWPVLATRADDAVLAPAIILSDHPELAPESLGNLFDNTEIEEALLLHIHALSDSERELICDQDPAVAEMVRKAAATTPEQMLSLHGRMRLGDPEDREQATPPAPSAGLAASISDQAVPPVPPPDALAELPGERDGMAIDGVSYRRGERVVLRLAGREDPYDRLLDGRIATIRRIRVDMDDRVHFAMSIDDDPMHQVLGETGRFLTFFAGEFEPIAAGAGREPR
jgi:hypothetical protein